MAVVCEPLAFASDQTCNRFLVRAKRGRVAPLIPNLRRIALVVQYSLQRMEDNGWVKGVWNTSENNRKAKYYSITASGRKQLAREQQDWDAITLAVPALYSL